jgi:uncharacterized protein
MTDLDDAIRRRTTGFRNLQLWVATFRPTGGLSAMTPFLDAHIDYALGLERAGFIFGGGPILDAAGGPTGEGMFILRAATLDEAAAAAEGDPMVVAGVRSVEVRPWRLNIGSLDVRLLLSNGGGHVS